MRHFRSFFFKKKFFKKIFKFYFFPVGKQSFSSHIEHERHTLGVSKAFHEYVLSIFRKLCASWALDIAPTLDVPVLLNLNELPILPAYQCQKVQSQYKPQNSAIFSVLLEKRQLNQISSWEINVWIQRDRVRKQKDFFSNLIAVEENAV